MSERILNDEKIFFKAQESLKQFFEISMSHDKDIRTIWDASKAFIQGFYIQQNIIQKRIRESKFKIIF